MFPLVVSEGVLTVDEEMDEVWCLAAENRTHPILEATHREVNFLFGEEVARKLLPPGAGGNGRGSPPRTA